jgi:tRNA(Ile2) C34 agmatinyltransferase TiaS
MSEYLYCGKCGSEMKSKGLARMEGLCQYCWDNWYHQEMMWIRRITQEAIE